MSTRAEELRLRWSRKEDVEADELTALLADADAEVRLLAARIDFEAKMRPALDALARSLGADKRFDAEAEWVAQGARLARYDEPMPYLLKAVGLGAMRSGDLENAVHFLFNSMIWAMRQGQAGDPRSRRLMRYALDPDFDRAYEEIAARISLPRYNRPPSGKTRVAVIIPFDLDGNSVGLVGTGIAAGLCKRGMDAFLVTTRMLDSPQTAHRRSLLQAGSRLVEAQGQTSLQKILWLLDYFEREPVHAAFYLCDPQDVVPRVCEIIGLANAQVYMNAAYEHRTGRFDVIIETVEPQQVGRSFHPEIARFIPTGIARDAAIRNAEPAARSTFGIPDDAVILATFGRISKAAQGGFLQAAATILQANPKAVWLIAGLGYAEEEATIRSALRSVHVDDRFINIGVRTDIPALLKMSDVYLDPFPFPGAQSTGEAMFAGLPIVAMQRARDVDLDPTETGPTSAAGEAIIGEAAPMAAPGDVAAYVAIAQRYIADAEERKRVGAALRARADAELTWDGMIDRYRDAIEDAIAQRAPVRDGELAAVLVVPSPLPLERTIARVAGDDGLYAASRIVVVVNGSNPELELRAQRYGERIRNVCLPESATFAEAARAGIAAAQAPLCAVLDGSLLPSRNWAAEGVAAARRHGLGRFPGGFVIAANQADAVQAALASGDGASQMKTASAELASPDSILQLQHRYEQHDEFSEAEIAAWCAHPDAHVRTFGERIVFEREAGPAFEAAMRLAQLDDTVADDLLALLGGAIRARQPQAYVAAMHLRAQRALARGDVEAAVVALGDGIRVGLSAGQLGVKRWHRLLHVATDPEWDALFETAAAKISAPRTYA
ncbi:MAG: glycosyltransferase, partial [Candidatus Eremiobacteraeota bacterium]|nr:glycosyltransferase [Candidatus Eremiobacteraeota bacterium]